MWYSDLETGEIYLLPCSQVIPMLKLSNMDRYNFDLAPFTKRAWDGYRGMPMLLIHFITRVFSLNMHVACFVFPCYGIKEFQFFLSMSISIQLFSKILAPIRLYGLKRFFWNIHVRYDCESLCAVKLHENNAPINEDNWNVFAKIPKIIPRLVLMHCFLCKWYRPTVCWFRCTMHAHFLPLAEIIKWMKVESFLFCELFLVMIQFRFHCREKSVLLRKTIPLGRRNYLRNLRLWWWGWPETKQVFRSFSWLTRSFFSLTRREATQSRPRVTKVEHKSLGHNRRSGGDFFPSEPKVKGHRK